MGAGAAKERKDEVAAAAPSGDVSLARYAAVKAAVAEGFSIEDVLAIEGLRPRAFARADVRWKQRLAAEPELLAAYQAELSHAEDWLDRRVEPLAEDAAAWASFLAAFEGHAEPFEVLQAKGLGMNDVSRLRRRWAGRAEKDATLGERLAELRAKPEKLGPLRLGPLVLRPSRMAQAKAPVEDRAGPAAGAPAPAAPVPEAARPASSAAIAAPAGLHTTAPVLELPRGPALPFARAERESESESERESESESESEGEAAVAKPAPEPPRAAESITGTAPTLDIPRGPALPFPGAAKPEVKRPASALAQTSMRLEIPRGPVLPFAPGPPSAPSTPGASSAPGAAGAPGALKAAAASPSPVVPKRAPEGLGETAPSWNVPPKPAVPFIDPLERVLPLAWYASLCAELSLFPHESEAIFRRYGLERAEQRTAVDAAWKERLRRNPIQYEIWQDMYRRYHARFAKQGAPPR